AYGLALCRGYLPVDECTSCLTNATITVTNTYCPNNRGAIIWRDLCMLKYSDVDFLGQIDTDNSFSFSSKDTVCNYEIFSKTAKELFGNLFKNAIAIPMEFADLDIQVPCANGNKTLHGMVQCTRDLSVDDCMECLNHAISFLTFHKNRERVVYGSCNLEYETT
ncbi:cysteine-rich repeat secretory protein 38, partial [Phtheirospermum japonicum]